MTMGFWRVTFGGFTIWEGVNEDEAEEVYRQQGPYGKIMYVCGNMEEDGCS